MTDSGKITAPWGWRKGRGLVRYRWCRNHLTWRSREAGWLSANRVDKARC